MAHLKELLGKEPHVVTFKGVKMTENEKKQIVASVGLAEMSADGFGSVNADQEFVGRKYGRKGIEKGISYPRIVHIGLSYGMIQFTQDGGALGEVLVKMRAKNVSKFDEIFGGGDSSIAQSLIILTTSGLPDLANNPSIPISGLAHWQKIKNTHEGKELTRLANQPTQSDLPVSREIRGKRVQPIPANKDDAPTDIWTGVWKQRFIDAGSVTDFQEAQIDYAVKNYMNPILPLAKKNNVRSALGLAYIEACAVRGGVDSPLSKSFYEVAKRLQISLPFSSSEDERTCIDAIANGSATTGFDKKGNNVKVGPEEIRRAKILIQDDLGFLAEDLYDTSTYE